MPLLQQNTVKKIVAVNVCTDSTEDVAYKEIVACLEKKIDREFINTMITIPFGNQRDISDTRDFPYTAEPGPASLFYV